MDNINNNDYVIVDSPCDNRNYKKSYQTKTIINKTVKSGITFGSCLAMIISYTAWKSIPWAIFHGFLSWIYVIYYIIKY